MTTEEPITLLLNLVYLENHLPRRQGPVLGEMS